MAQTDFCGCCGREAVGDWCRACQPHILKAPLPPEDRTYFAQFGKDCPYQLPGKNTPHIDELESDEFGCLQHDTPMVGCAACEAEQEGT